MSSQVLVLHQKRAMQLHRYHTSAAPQLALLTLIFGCVTENELGVCGAVIRVRLQVFAGALSF